MNFKNFENRIQPQFKDIESISGTVIHGNGKGGKVLGIPTLNIIPENEVEYAQGVYASVTRIYGDYYYGITNIGTNPSIRDDSFTHKLRVETHLFDVDKELYNKTAEVWPIVFVREQREFESIDELKAQIEKDIEYVREYFSREQQASNF